jgi:hypothetical protein
MTSRMHCKIQCSGRRLLPHRPGEHERDLPQREKVRELVKLEHGDLIKIGDTLFTFPVGRVASATSLAASGVGGTGSSSASAEAAWARSTRPEQVDLQRIVGACKVISEEHTKDKDFVDLFIHEGRARRRS